MLPAFIFCKTAIALGLFQFTTTEGCAWGKGLGIHLVLYNLHEDRAAVIIVQWRYLRLICFLIDLSFLRNILFALNWDDRIKAFVITAALLANLMISAKELGSTPESVYHRLIVIIASMIVIYLVGLQLIQVHSQVCNMKRLSLFSWLFYISNLFQNLLVQV